MNFLNNGALVRRKRKDLVLEKQGLKMKVVEDKRSCPKEDNWGYPVTINLIT
jgi:hypothetical protein